MWNGVVWFGGTVLAVAVCSDCYELGLWLRGSNSVVKLHGGRVQSGWCRQVGGWHFRQLLCLKVTARYLGSGYGLKLGRQAAWRPGTIGMVSSSLLAALCKQLPCLKVTALHLGSGYGLKLGRQAAWRPGTIGMVSSSWLAAPCKQLLCVKVTARYLGSGFLAQLGRQAAWRPRCIVKVSSDWWHRVGSCCCDCLMWALVWARARSSSCLAAEVHSNWCRLVGGIVFAVVVTGNCWDLNSGRGLPGCLVTGVQSAWLTKAQSHSGLVRSCKFLRNCVGKTVSVGQSSRNLWCGSE